MAAHAQGIAARPKEGCTPKGCARARAVAARAGCCQRRACRTSCVGCATVCAERAHLAVPLCVQNDPIQLRLCVCRTTPSGCATVCVQKRPHAAVPLCVQNDPIRLCQYAKSSEETKIITCDVRGRVHVWSTAVEVLSSLLRRCVHEHACAPTLDKTMLMCMCVCTHACMCGARWWRFSAPCRVHAPARTRTSVCLWFVCVLMHVCVHVRCMLTRYACLR